MFVKWRKETLQDRARSVTLRAEIVKSFRDPVTTKPRSQFIAYLGSIKESYCSVPVAQERFWREVEAKLSLLHLAPEDEQNIREKLLARVPRPKSWAEILAPYAGFSRRILETTWQKS
jgi:hypothetical protein